MGFISDMVDVVGEVDKVIRSTQDPKGLAIAIGLEQDEDHLSEKIAVPILKCLLTHFQNWIMQPKVTLIFMALCLQLRTTLSCRTTR